jgi:hypothetical protein
MKHLLIKNFLTLKGAGGGKPSTPPPPIVSQFPSVLAPPQFGNFNSINSFSYAEMIDLLADGPIEGLINKNGRKVYDENIFEGIYLNDTAVKETSSIENQYTSINFLKNGLKKLWKITNPELSVKSLTLKSKNINDIDDPNFDSDITLTYYPPNLSVARFTSLLGGDLNSSLLINRAFDLSPIKGEKPFLTEITIPSFNLFLDRNKFDFTEGGYLSPAPFQLGISNISEHFYFTVGYDSLKLFNYFELPRSFVINNQKTTSNKKTFNKTKIENPLYLQYRVTDVKIVIWSIFDLQLSKPKNFDLILDKYFTNLITFQNKTSLFNYNLVSSEFRSGSEIQIPLNGFVKTEMDIEFNKELIGPFRITNDFNPSSAFGAGGVQRLNSLCLRAGIAPPVNLSLPQETSDDIRFLKTWSIGESDQNGNPYVICSVKSNYSQFDRTSTNRSASAATPVTHYISNQSVEEVYVTLNVNQLSDTNHVELVCSTNKVGSSNKSQYTEGPPQGMPNYSQLPGVQSVASSNICKLYLLIYGQSIQDGLIMAGNKSITGLFNNICLTIYKDYSTPAVYNMGSSLSLYCKAISCWGNEGALIYDAYINDPNLITLQQSISSLSPQEAIIAERSIASSLSNSKIIFDGTLCMKSPSALRCYMLPNENCLFIPTLGTKSYVYDSCSFESKLKSKNFNGNLIYNFALDDIEKISSSDYFKSYSLPAVPNTTANWTTITGSLTSEQAESFRAQNPALTESIYNYQRCNLFNKLNEKNASDGKFFIATFDYFSPSNSNKELKHITSVLLNDLIPFDQIFNNWTSAGFTEVLFGVSGNKVTIKIDASMYPFIDKYIIKPFIANCFSRYVNNNNFLSLNIGAQSAIGYIYSLGVTLDYLVSINSIWWMSNYAQAKINLNGLEFLLSNSIFVSDYPASKFSNGVASTQTDIISTNTLESELKKIEQGKLIGNMNLISFSIITSIAGIPWYTKEQSYIKNNYNILSEPSSNTFNRETYIPRTFNANTNATLYYDPNLVYMADKTKNNVYLVASNTTSYNNLIPPGENRGAYYWAISNFRDAVFQYTLTPESQINSTTNTLTSSAKYGFAKDGQVTNFDFSKSTQTLAAGAKLPAIVSVKIETGYEGQEQEQKFNTSEYFAYQYDIFGLASEQALVDLGRISQDYVFTKKISSETGGYFQNIKNEYLYGNKIYLFRVTHRRNGVDTNFDFFDKNFKKLSNLNLASTAAELIANNNLQISLIIGDSPQKTIGLRQTIGAIDALEPTDADKFAEFDNAIYLWLNDSKFYTVNASNSAAYFSNSYRTLILSSAVSFLKRVSKGDSLIPINSYPSESYITSAPVSGNSSGFDRYELFVDANNYLRVDVFTYPYTIFNVIDVSTGAIVPISDSSNLDKSFINSELYVTLYRESINANTDFATALQNAFPEDLIYPLFNDNTHRFFARFSKTQEPTGSTSLDKIRNGALGFVGQVISLAAGAIANIFTEINKFLR